jgi:hypothetical protein
MYRSWPPVIVIAVLLSAAPGLPASGQDLEPRQYSNLPVGLNFLIAGVSASRGSVLVDPAIEFENAKSEIRGPIVAYARSLALRKKSAKLDAVVGRTCLTGTAEYRGQAYSRDVCGLTDPEFRLSVNFFGAPALDMHQFSDYRQDLVVGASLQVTAPLGQYDTASLINIGANRWSAKLEFGLSQTIQEWFFELALAGTFYEENTEFLDTESRKQDPVFSLQAHAVRSFASGFWLALDSTKYRGGRTRTNGLPDLNFQSNTRLGITASIPIGPSHSIKLIASTGISTRTGSDYDLVAANWQFRW